MRKQEVYLGKLDRDTVTFENVLYYYNINFTVDLGPSRKKMKLSWSKYNFKKFKGYFDNLAY